MLNKERITEQLTCVWPEQFRCVLFLSGWFFAIQHATIRGLNNSLNSWRKFQVLQQQQSVVNVQNTG